MNKTYSLSHLATYLDAELVGEPDYMVYGIATLQSADAGHVSFVANPTYQKYLSSTHAGALIISPQLAPEFSGNKLVVANPYLSYARLTGLFDTQPLGYQGIHPSAVVDSSAIMGEGVSVGANAVIAAGAVIGAGVQIGAGTYVGEDSCVGARTRLAANVTVYHGVVVGCDCIIHSGAVIGADGFGFAPQEQAWVKIHQLGGVVIGDRVEIGANTAIDRGALDNTVIEDGVKLDNLLQIGHNVRIGRNTAVAAHTAIAGSTVLGENCTISGCVGISGHLNIADNVHITAMTMVSSSITQAGSYSSGTPIAPTPEWRKNAARFRRLDNMATRIKALEKNQQN